MKKKRYLFLYGPLNGGGAERVFLIYCVILIILKMKYTYVSFAVVEHL